MHAAGSKQCLNFRCCRQYYFIHKMVQHIFLYLLAVLITHREGTQCKLKSMDLLWFSLTITSSGGYVLGVD